MLLSFMYYNYFLKDLFPEKRFNAHDFELDICVLALFEVNYDTHFMQ